jgi:hypothetical protein
METSPALTPPARKMFGNRFFTWRLMRKVLFVLAASITLAALFIAEEDWRGARAWANYKRTMEAKGDHFDAARLIPATVPDDENFAKTPFLAAAFALPPGDSNLPFKGETNKFGDGYYAAANAWTNISPPWFDLPVKFRPHPLEWDYGMAENLNAWAAVIQGTNAVAGAAEVTDPIRAANIILDNLKGCDPTLAELYSAATRPYCRFNIAYEQWNQPPDIEMMMGHYVQAKWLVRFLTLHAKAEMVSGHSDEALKDLGVLFRFDDGLKDEPLLISQLVRLACTSVMLQSVGEGLAEHRWSEAQLEVLQERLRKTDLLASTVLAFHGERDICFNPHFDHGSFGVRGWGWMEQLNLNRAFNETVLPRLDLSQREISPSVNHSMDLAFQRSYEAKGFSAVLHAVLHHDIMASMTLPAYAHVGEKVAFAQSEVDMAMLACALERFRLAQGQYPDTLEALVPRFAAALPQDIINGQPLKYRRLENGRFILYSVGWNEKDDGGVVAATKGTTPRQDQLQGDWVFQYPDNP